MAEQNRLVVDKEKVQKAAQNAIPLSITTYMMPHDMEVYMNEVLTLFLQELGQAHMTEYLVYCLNELTTNAKKANTKRVYFQEKGLDITNPDDYETGMKSFKMDTLGNITHYLQKQREAGLYIKVIYQSRGNKVKLEVRNNCPLTVFEYKRIHDKICRAQSYDTMEMALEQIVDDTEGAGLGLIIMILMLRKVGLTDDDYQVLVENDETVVHVELPFSDENKQNFETISQELIQLINELPSFPENVVNINRLISDPDSDMAQIAVQISNDVALTADLLKMVNSAAFRPVNLCQNVADAVKMVGLQGIRNLLFSIGTMKALGENTEEKRKLWQHAYCVAFYSYHLAKTFFANDKQLVSDAYVCGLLHDIGKIIFTTAHKSTIDQLVTVSAQKNIPFQIIEQMVAGTNHEVLGARIAQKWNFPDTIVASIRYHHEPEAASAEFTKITSIVSLANLLTYYTAGEIEFYQIDANMLSLFNIKTEEQLKSISDKLAQAFEREQQR